jgi:hypothetical protein
MADALRAAGMGQWFAAMDIFPAMDPDAEFSLELKIHDGVSLLGGTYDGKPVGVIDRQSIELQGQRVRFFLQACGADVEWTRQGSTLTLTVVDDNCPDHLGTPDVAYMTALYASVPFELVG